MKDRKFEIGDLVFHEEYGVGVVIIIDYAGDLGIEFSLKNRDLHPLDGLCNEYHGYWAEPDEVIYSGKSALFHEHYQIYTELNFERAKYLVGSSTQVFFFNCLKNSLDLERISGNLEEINVLRAYPFRRKNGASYRYIAIEREDRSCKRPTVTITMDEIAAKFGIPVNHIQIKKED